MGIETDNICYIAEKVNNADVLKNGICLLL